MRKSNLLLLSSECQPPQDVETSGREKKAALLAAVSKRTAQGQTAAEIGQALGLTPRQIHRYRAQARQRIRSERGELMAEAREWEVFRLNELLFSVWAKATDGDLKAHRAALDTLAQMRSVFSSETEPTSDESGQVAALLQLFAQLPQDEPITPREIMGRLRRST